MEGLGGAVQGDKVGKPSTTIHNCVSAFKCETTGFPAVLGTSPAASVVTIT